MYLVVLSYHTLHVVVESTVTSRSAVAFGYCYSVGSCFAASFNTMRHPFQRCNYYSTEPDASPLQPTPATWRPCSYMSAFCKVAVVVAAYALGRYSRQETNNSLWASTIPTLRLPGTPFAGVYPRPRSTHEVKPLFAQKLNWLDDDDDEEEEEEEFFPGEGIAEEEGTAEEAESFPDEAVVTTTTANEIGMTSNQVCAARNIPMSVGLLPRIG